MFKIKIQRPKADILVTVDCRVLLLFYRAISKRF